MKNVDACKRPASASILADGTNKSRYAMTFSWTASFPHSRHPGHSWNLPMADGHAESDRDAVGFSVNGAIWRSNGWIVEDNEHARLYCTHPVKAGTDRVSYG